MSSETAVWTYPWDLHAEGLSASCRRLADSGVDTVVVAAHYHSVRSFNPRTTSYTAYPGGLYTTPAADRFDDVTITPPRNEVRGTDDPVGDVVAAAGDHGLSVAAWTVCLHNTRLGREHPAYRIEGAFGDAHAHSPCPSRAAVRDYFAAVVGTLVDRGVAEIQLESLGFPTVRHGHGEAFGHEKLQVPMTTAAEFLFSQCFCDGCLAAAADHAVDLDAAASLVRELCRRHLDRPAETPAFEELLATHRPLRRLLDFRATVVTRLVERLVDAADGVPCTYYALEWPGPSPADVRPTGVDLDRLSEHLDRTVALCYTDDPGTAERYVAALAERTDGPVDAGVTLDPSVVADRAALRDIVATLDATAADRLLLYHDGIATNDQREWMATACTDWR